MTYKLLKKLSILSLGILFAFGCNDDDGPSPITVNFSSAEVSIDQSLLLIFSRPPEFDATITVEVNSGSLVYGQDQDFTTEPEAVSDLITVPVEAGSDGTIILVSVGEGINIQQDERVSFTIRAGDNIIPGDIASTEVVFNENFIAPSGSTELVAGSDFSDQVFFDLSKISASAVPKDSWDLAFYAGDEFYVTLNNAAGVMARALDESDITAVDAADSAGFGGTMVVNGFAPPGSTAWVDDPSGDLTKTALGEITTSSSAVFIVKGAAGLWQKIQLTRVGDDYELQHGDIDATTVTTQTISKDPSSNFVFFSFSEGPVTVEPTMDSWDLSYSSYMTIINFGYELPYVFNDIITINRSGTSIATVMTDGSTNYEGFTLEDAQSLTDFSTEVNAVGSTWRTSAGPGMPPAVSEDRFFVLEDGEGNYYKIQFQSLTNSSGERGHLSFGYELL